jgi:hypothetical protein
MHNYPTGSLSNNFRHAALGVRQTYESMTLEGEALLVPFR